MSWVRFWTHVVFTTKNREPILKKEYRLKIFNHIKDQSKNKGIIISEINGYIEHVHCLLLLNKDISIAKTMQLIKGESSFWINKNKITNTKFKWQDDYWAVSVSESHVKKVRDYIINQENHHNYIPFEQEVELFMKKYGWAYIKHK